VPRDLTHLGARIAGAQVWNRWDLNSYPAPAIRRHWPNCPVFWREEGTRRSISALLDLGQLWGFCGGYRTAEWSENAHRLYDATTVSFDAELAARAELGAVLAGGAQGTPSHSAGAV